MIRQAIGVRCRSRVDVSWWTIGAIVIALFCVMIPLRAQAETTTDSSASPSPSAAEPSQPGEAALPWQQGPKLIELGQDLTLDVSERFAFLERTPAAKLLEKNGSIYNDNLLGVVIGTQPDDDWFVVIRFDPEGYIKDDEEIDAKELLDTLREGQTEANKERSSRGFEPLTLEGWQEPPHYAKQEHRLIWGLNVGVQGKPGVSVNYNTRILGRKGYVSLNLVTDPDKLAVHKPLAHELLSKTSFKTGARYEDFNKDTDKVAEYGLGGLVLAGAGLGAAKLVKIGLLAKFGKVLIGLIIAGKKLIVFLVIGLIAALKGIFGKKKASAAGPDADAATAQNAENDSQQSE